MNANGMPTSEVLYRAADLIEERGWTQGSFGWPMGLGNTPLCIEGGVMAALGTDYLAVDLSEFWSCPAYRAVQSYLGLSHDLSVKDKESRPSPVDPLWRFNDHSAAERVIEVLRAAALVEAARESATDRQAVAR